MFFEAAALSEAFFFAAMISPARASISVSVNAMSGTIAIPAVLSRLVRFAGECGRDIWRIK
jgi:hypothetical protein